MTFAEEFAEALTKKFAGEPYMASFHVMKGRRYDKIVLGNSVFAFVEKLTGELMKAQTWNQPAKNIVGESFKKYFLATTAEFNVALYNADRFGAFLYNDYVVQLPEIDS